jgi:hypothetical protein
MPRYSPLAISVSRPDACDHVLITVHVALTRKSGYEPMLGERNFKPAVVRHAIRRAVAIRGRGLTFTLRADA